MRILQRYIWRELAINFLAVTTVLLAILLVYQGGAVLARAAELQYPSAVVLRLFVLGAVRNIALLLPFGLLLAVVLGFGRLYHDSELFAAQACGLDVRRCLTTVLALALPVAAAAALLTLVLAPRAAVGEAALRAAAVRSALAIPLQAGQFRALGGGTVVYARGAAGGELTEVFIKHSNGPVVETTVAQRARYQVSDDGLAQSITLYDGERLEGEPGSSRYRLLRFAELSIPINVTPPVARARRLAELPTSQLLVSSGLSEHSELQTRYSWPLMALVLALAAVPLSRLRPRQGRFAKVGLAILVFALYANLLQVANLWLERGRIAPQLGLWWVHGLFLLLALGLQFASGWRRRWVGARR